MEAAIGIGTLDPTVFQCHYLNEQTADVFFVCKSDNGDVRVPAHKFMLSAKSPAFYAMFYGSLREEADIPIPTTAIAFREFLKFIYLNDVELTMDTIRDVVDLMKQHQMTNGLRICENFLVQNLAESNFLFVFELASLYDMLKLKQYCEISAPNLIKAESLQTCTRDELVRVLQVGQLQTKFNLVEICAQWARRACEHDSVEASMGNMRTYLHDATDHIDFGSMSNRHIHKNVQEFSELLSKDGMKRMILTMKERGSPCDVELVQYRLLQPSRKRYIDRFETMTLQSDTLLALKTVGLTTIFCDGDEDDSDDEEFEMEYDDGSGRPLSGQLVILKHFLDDASDKSIILLREAINFQTYRPLYVHRFESSVIIEPYVKYSLQVQISMRDMKPLYVRSELADDVDYQHAVLQCSGKTIISSLGYAIDYGNYTPY